MSAPQKGEEENLAALGALHRGGPPRPAPTPSTAAAPPLPPPLPALRPTPGNAAAADEEPRYRCLACGYPLLSDEQARCAECGRTYDAETLEHWFGGDERRRFEHVIWLVLATLFVKLLVLPELWWVARVAGAIVILAAGFLAYRGKQDSVGGYFALAAMVIGGLMILGFSWGGRSLAYYTLDMIAGCVLLLAMLHDPVCGPIGRMHVGRRIAPVLLFLAPPLAIACWIIEQTLSSANPGALFGPPPLTLAGHYPLFSFVVPYLAAAGMWFFVWWTLAGVRRVYFGEAGAP